VNMLFPFWSFCRVCRLFIELQTGVYRMKNTLYQWVRAESTSQVTPQRQSYTARPCGLY
jgi:hypothetical protein